MDKIEKIARAMCIADGHNPDERMGGGPNDFALHASEFTGHAVMHYRPSWMAYQRQANLIMSALDEILGAE